MVSKTTRLSFEFWGTCGSYGFYIYVVFLLWDWVSELVLVASGFLMCMMIISLWDS